MPPSSPVVPDQAAGREAPGRRRWWAPAPEPMLPIISTRRAYAEVVGAWAAFFLTGVIGAALLLGDRYKDPLVDASWALYVPQAVDSLIQIGLAVTVVLLLAARRGVGPAELGLRLPRADGRIAAGRLTRIFAWAIFAQVIGGIVNALLQTGHLPTSAPTAPELIFAVADSVQAGIVEEIVVLAFVVVTLRQAGRPWWEVTAVALVLRGSYHIYYGPGVVGILVWAGLFYWVFLRTRVLVALIVTHALWDAVGFLSQRWSGVAAVGLLVAVGLWIAAPITWLTERSSSRPAQWRPAGSRGGWWPASGGSGPWETGWGSAGWPDRSAPGGPVVGGPPVGASGVGGWGAGGADPTGAVPRGWYPDPSGRHHWRWWDGSRWTEHVAGP